MVPLINEPHVNAKLCDNDDKRRHLHAWHKGHCSVENGHLLPKGDVRSLETKKSIYKRWLLQMPQTWFGFLSECSMQGLLTHFLGKKLRPKIRYPQTVTFITFSVHRLAGWVKLPNTYDTVT